MEAAEHDSRLGSVVDGRYRILDCMAAGSMGVVYRAERVPVGKTVAIKFLHNAFAGDPEFLGRFERETRVMSKLAHPHCVSVVDFGVSEGAPYLVMDYVQGTTLRQILDDQIVEVPRALALMRQVLAGLAHAHAQGIVHRDIKPANLIISEEIGTGPHVRILDFGLARLRGALGANATQSNIVVGTPSYMAPEQTVDAAVDLRADIYAAGVVLFEMITGEKPYRCESTLDLLAMHRGAPIPRLANVAPPGVVIPRGLQEVIDRALAKDPADRFQSAMEFSAALDAVGSGTFPAERNAESLVESLPPVIIQRRRSSMLPMLILFAVVGGVIWWFKDRDAALLRPQPAQPSRAKARVTAPPPDAAPALAAAGSQGTTTTTAGSAAATATVDAAVAVPEVVTPPDAGVAAVPAITTPDAAPVAVPPPIAAADAGVALAATTVPGVPDPLLEEPDDPVEPDPATAEDPNPVAAPPEGMPEDEQEAPDAPEKIDEEVEKKAPPPKEPMAKTIKGAVRLIQAGKKELALRSLRTMWPQKKASAYIPFLLGNLYFDKRWWSVALDHYRIAIKKNAAYKRNGTLVRNVIRMLGNKKTDGKASFFLRKTIGRPAKPYLKYAAKRHKNPTVRKKAAWLLKRIK